MGVAYDTISAAIKASADAAGGVIKLISGTPGSRMKYPNLPTGTVWDTGRIWIGSSETLVRFLTAICDYLDTHIDGQWQYIDTTLPTGVTAAIEALYQLDETASYLLDRGPAGRDLSLGGNEPRVSALEGLAGRVFYDDATGHWLQTAVDAALAAAAGALTVEMILTTWPTGDTDAQLAICGDPASETEANNFLFCSRVNPFGAVSAALLSLLIEYGPGTNVETDTNVYHPDGGIYHYAVTRAADGVTSKIYMDGILLDTVVAAHAPSGGTSARIFVGGYNAASTFDGIMFSARLTFTEFTAAQVLEAYRRCRGLL
uniref:Putative lectin/glucanase superfamily protein n=1 Tax=viral metagenome TaxID=1070528 RepID=A0A6H1Z924_9ZZZZ